MLVKVFLVWRPFIPFSEFFFCFFLLPGSKSITDCICDPGYYGSSSTSCTPCPPGSYCFNESIHPCHDHATSLPNSSSIQDCICMEGFFDPNSSTTCTPCTVDPPCPMGTFRSTCTPTSDSTCSGSCTIPSDNPMAYTWTSNGGYNDSCTMVCNPMFHRVSTPNSTHELCMPCNQNPASCPPGFYLQTCDSSTYQDSSCQSCSSLGQNAHFTSYGTLDGGPQSCEWSCDGGWWWNDLETGCQMCAAGQCDGAGYYASACIPGGFGGGIETPGNDSMCIHPCTGIGGTSDGYTWTSGGTYDFVNWKGVNDCKFSCNFMGGMGYYTTTEGCIKITPRNATCPMGTYVIPATLTNDTTCGGVCTNYPVNFTVLDLLSNESGKFRWHSPGSYNDPYGLLGFSTCEWECYEGPFSVGGWYFDTSQPYTLGTFQGYPTHGTCSRCNSSNCTDLGTYRGTCQAFSHDDPGTCVECMAKKVANSVPVDWVPYQFPGQDSCQFACIPGYFHNTSSELCTKCTTDPSTCANGFYLDTLNLCTNNSDSFCEPCAVSLPASMHAHWSSPSMTLDDYFCLDAPWECDMGYYFGGGTCIPCNIDYTSCSPGTYLPLCQPGSTQDASCTPCNYTNPPNSDITRGLTHGLDSCSYTCHRPAYFDNGGSSCQECNTQNLSICPTGKYLEACSVDKDSLCKSCTNLPPSPAFFSSFGSTFNVSTSCPWSCPPGYFNNGTSCKMCFQGPCNIGEYPHGCWEGTDASCVPCTNAIPQKSEYISQGTVVGLLGNNDCMWRCLSGFFGANVGSGVRWNSSTVTDCVSCNSTVCPPGKYRSTCQPGSSSDSTCATCTPQPPPPFGVYGLANPYNQDNCDVICGPGFSSMNRMCCSDNSYFIESEGVCTCSAGFRLSGSFDCVP